MGVLLMPRAAVASPFPLQTSGWYSRRQLNYRGDIELSWHYEQNFWRRWFCRLFVVGGPQRSTNPGHLHARRYEGRAPSPCCKLPLWNSM